MDGTKANSGLGHLKLYDGVWSTLHRKDQKMYLKLTGKSIITFFFHKDYKYIEAEIHYKNKHTQSI